MPGVIAIPASVSLVDSETQCDINCTYRVSGGRAIQINQTGKSQPSKLDCAFASSQEAGMQIARSLAS